MLVIYRNLDMITIMSYDFHGYYDGYTGANAPLYSSPEDTTADAKLLNVVSFYLLHIVRIRKCDV